jgi:hypothetical protein
MCLEITLTEMLRYYTSVLRPFDVMQVKPRFVSFVGKLLMRKSGSKPADGHLLAAMHTYFPPNVSMWVVESAHSLEKSSVESFVHKW